MSSFDYVNQHYGVNACVGRRVIAYGEPGTIVRDFGNYIGIVLDSAPHADPRRYHPTDGIKYGDIIEYTPPEINARQAKAKCNYREYQDADYGHDFAEWLGINVPRVDYDSSRGEWRMYRYGDYRDSSIYGEWCKTKKAAKASYKDALKKYRTA
ncbi:hypothetical protein LW347_05010 [Pectobacterium polonicum]|uniref:Uncharacterized protein n=1 Tax=Pectobacterium polonicum TaxID=2485124 RepID=A0AAE9T2A0_9GAMM|nr:hypothetical protein [Pectobacterium polonicum]UVO09337.1 hypothetical protein LW347_05010 [Pectobacterium polonicum]